MKKRLLICLTFFALMLSAELSWAANTYDWAGGTSTAWNDGRNWKIGATTQLQANYPGATVTTDIVQIGVAAGTITNWPVVGATPANNIASITIGVVGGTSPSLTINSPAVLTLNGAITYTTASVFTATLAGTGTISATNLNITTTSAGTSSDVSTLTSSITTLTLSGSLAITTSSHAGNKFHDITLSLTGGTLSLAGIQTTNSLAGNTSTVAIGNNTTLNFTGGTAAELATLGTPGTNSITFGTGVTIGYTGSVAQTVYTGAAITNSSLTTGISYTNITFSGTGIKTASTGNLNVSGNFTNSLTSDGSNFVDFNTNNTPVNFTGTTQTLAGGAGTGTQFKTLTFSGGGTKTMSTGTFSLASSGTLTLSGSSTLATGGILTLNSDATGSATIAAIPAGSSITGNVIVQRYITGGSSSYRGYRLLSSPVNDSQLAGGTGFYDLSFLTNANSGSYLTGAAGGGFDATGNPTLYLYRDDVTPSNASFSAGNYRAITKINNANLYSLTTIDGTQSLPVGTGVLYFYRGNGGTNPATVPSNLTFTHTGPLNQGQIIVKYWVTGSAGLDFGTAAGNGAVKGFNLVGNPYASSIDWNLHFGNVTSTNTIYAPNVGDAIYIYNTTTKNYSVWTSTSTSAGTASGSPGGSNIIPSGQGFFVLATAASPQLIFNETAKISLQPGTLLLNAATPFTDQHLRLQLSKDSINKDETVLLFNSAATVAYKPNEDALYLSGAGVLSLSNRSSDNAALALNQLPFPAKTQAIPLNVGATGSGTYQLNLTEAINIPPMYDVWLMDNYKKDSLDIKHNPTYSFTIITSDTASFGSNRFKLVIRLNAALSVHLLSFTGVQDKKQITLTWTAENEENYTTYVLQRSIDGGHTFTTLDSLTSANLGTYNDIDPNPVTGINLYRLKQIDVTGNVSYSDVLSFAYTPSILTSNNNAVSVYPNPVKYILGVVIKPKGDKQANYKITVTNNMGMIINTATTTVPIWLDDVVNLLPGTYFVNVTNSKDNSFVGRATFIKL